MSAYSVKNAKKSVKADSIVLTSFNQLTVAPVDFGLINDLLGDVLGQEKVIAKQNYDTLRTQAFKELARGKELAKQKDYLESSAKSLLSKINADFDAWKKTDQGKQLSELAWAQGEDVGKAFYTQARAFIHDLAIQDESYAEWAQDLDEYHEVNPGHNLVDMLFFLARETAEFADRAYAESSRLFDKADEELRAVGLSKIVTDREAARKAKK
jgi:hypothetical protein